MHFLSRRIEYLCSSLLWDTPLCYWETTTLTATSKQSFPAVTSKAPFQCFLPHFCFILFGLVFEISRIPGWYQTHYVAEDGLGLRCSCLHPQSAGIIDYQHEPPCPLYCKLLPMGKAQFLITWCLEGGGEPMAMCRAF